MKVFQQFITLAPRKRGFHLVTTEIVRALAGAGGIRTGMCSVFIQHTSASLCISENADPSVRTDFETFFNRIVPENDPGYIHKTEGSDDMPAHLKAALLGSSILVPVSNGALALGTWQGIYLCEHRNHGGPREIVVTVWGD